MSTSKSTNVLSDKVNRALHVRTDTPAMRAALAALASLPSSSSNDANKSTSAAAGESGAAIIDAKSVRAAIETDALRRALQFQMELKKLALDATTLRERVDNVTRAASHIGKIVDGCIIDKELGQILMNGGKNGGDNDSVVVTSKDDAINCDMPSSWEMERVLASKLHAAHKSYVDATQRQSAVDAFLDKFDLGEKEARLLDHYNFQGFLQGEGGGEHDDDNFNPWCHQSAALNINPNPSGEVMEDAISFLKALERLVIIRKELSKTFGGGTTSTADGVGASLVCYGNDDFEDQSPSGQLGTNSALRMMEQLATRQERAHERLYTFLQYFLGIGSAAPTSHHNVPTSSNDMGRSFYSVSDASSQVRALGRFQDSDDMDEAFGHPIIRRALRVLRHSPSHHIHALELIASSRRTELTRRFLLALTSGYGGMAPLEMRAHDPVGYVGDMLAFAFRAFRVEGELVKTLLLREEKDGDDPDETQQDEVYDGVDTLDSNPMSVSEMLTQSMGGLARPLKTRLSQVIMSLASQGGAAAGGESGTAVNSSDDDDDDTSSSLSRLAAIYSVCGLLRFYCFSIEKALEKVQIGNEVNNENPLLVTCDESLIEAANCYVASIRAYGAMLGSHSMCSSQTEAQLAQRAITLIAEERVSSPGFADDALSLDSGEDDLIYKQLSMSFLVRTLMDATMTHLKTLNDTSTLKLAINAASKSGLDATETTKWMKLIDEKEQNLVGVLVGAEADIVLEACGLGAIRSGIRDIEGEGMTLASYPGLSANEVGGALKHFYASLFSPPIPTFEDTIKDAELRKIARSRTAQIVIDVYQEVYEALTSEKGGYTDTSFLGHDPNQVKALLSL